MRKRRWNKIKDKRDRWREREKKEKKTEKEKDTGKAEDGGAAGQEEKRKTKEEVHGSGEGVHMGGRHNRGRWRVAGECGDR